MRRTTSTLLCLGLVLQTAACASNVERHWGEAQRANAEVQIADPLAPLRNDGHGVGALDGTTAENADVRLREHELGAGTDRDLPSFIQIGTGQ
jgi:hypothetical protein